MAAKKRSSAMNHNTRATCLALALSALLGSPLAHADTAAAPQNAPATAPPANLVYGKVISKIAVYMQVQVPQQQCVNQQQWVQRPNSGAGAVTGAVLGGLLGNAVGGGAGKALGDQAEANANPPQATTVQSCQMVNTTQQQFVGYDVTYEYQGQQYSARLASDPGNQVALRVQLTPDDATVITPVAPVATTPAYTTPVTTTTTTTVNPPLVYSSPTVIYAPPPVYWWPFIGLHFDWGWFGGGHGGHGGGGRGR
jgi:uncharacterized protein YcfJ